MRDPATVGLVGRGAPDRSGLNLADYVAGVRACDRAVLGRAITLVESRRPDHRELASQLLSQLLPHTGHAHRVGITGVPGVGKSTFIDALGTNLTASGHKVAVLAVDPSSGRTGGSILGDKTRMPHLAVDDQAFIRPSPTAGTLGGVARKTRESMLLCEAAGFDIVLVETVGVGQSETAVKDMVDFFLVLMIAGAGDELQGIKKGVLELADMIAVNKADGDNVERAERAARDYASALKLLRPSDPEWSVPVMTCSGRDKMRLEEVWDAIAKHHRLKTETGELDRLRREQRVRWMWSLIEDGLMEAARTAPELRDLFPKLERDLRDGRTTPGAAADAVLKQLRS